MSIKNHVALSISHIHIYNNPTIKKIHYAINVTSTEAELFAICYGINQAIRLPQVITDSLHAAKKIFNSLIHPYQIHSATISHKLREFFIESNDNHIKFWDCLRKLNWLLCMWVNKDTKSFISSPNFPNKLSWDFYKKHDFDSILAQWKMLFQASDSKERNFLELLCCSNHLLERHLWYTDFSKALSRLSSSGDYKRTQQEALAVLLLYLYKYNVVHATTMCLPHVLLLIHCTSTSRPPCHVHIP